MLDDAVNNSRKQRGRPFKPGASGNPRGLYVLWHMNQQGNALVAKLIAAKLP